MDFFDDFNRKNWALWARVIFFKLLSPYLFFSVLYRRVMIELTRMKW